MDLSRPHMALSPTLDGDALRVLAGTTHPLTGREIARLAEHGSQRGIALALNRLVEQGLVLRQEAGSSALYALNRSHLASPAVEILAGLRSEFQRRLRDAIGAWNIQPVHASLFGSAARGDGDTTSDIDLLIVRRKAIEEDDPCWRDQLALFTEQVHSWTGNYAAVIELGQDELGELRRTRPPIVASLRTDAIDLAGINIGRLLDIEDEG